MSEMALQRDIGAYISSRIALGPNTVVSSTLVPEQDGEKFDRQSFTNESEPPLSAALVFPFNVIGGTTAVAGWAISVHLQHSDTTESTAFADATFKDGTTVFESTISNDTDAADFLADGVLSVNVNLGKLKRFVRCQVTHDYSGTTSSSRTMSIGGVWVTGGSNIIPAA